MIPPIVNFALHDWWSKIPKGRYKLLNDFILGVLGIKDTVVPELLDRIVFL